MGASIVAGLRRLLPRFCIDFSCQNDEVRQGFIILARITIYLGLESRIIVSLLHDVPHYMRDDIYDILFIVL